MKGVPPFEIDETGETFEENSYIKASEIMKHTGKMTIADDFGHRGRLLERRTGNIFGTLCRISGDGADKANNAKLIDLVKDVFL